MAATGNLYRQKTFYGIDKWKWYDTIYCVMEIRVYNMDYIIQKKSAM
jgi:hypothetical protein